MKLGWSILILVGLLNSCNLFPDPPIRAIALVIGGGYNEAGAIDAGNNLGGALNDANGIAGLFHSKGYEVWLRMDNNAPQSYDPALTSGITNKQAGTLAQIRLDFAALKDALKDKDLFIFYYAGHAGNNSTQIIPKGITPTSYKPNPSKEYLLLNGSIPGPVLNLALSDTELGQLLKALPSSLPKVVIVDACQSGGMVGPSSERWTDPIDTNNPDTTYTVDRSDLWGKMFAQVIQRDVEVESAVVLAASTEWELSWETDPKNYLPDAYLATSNWPITNLKHGVFTLALQNGIKGGADLDNDKLVSVDELYNFSKQYIDKYWNKKRVGGERMTPAISGGRVNYILSKTGP